MEVHAMNMRQLIPWSRTNGNGSDNTSLVPRRDEEAHSFLTLHREMNRLFDDVFRGMPGFGGFGSGAMASWPALELAEDDQAIRISAELPGMDEKDVDVVFQDGLLAIRGEKRSDVEARDRRYSEHHYGRFERVIPVPVEVDPDQVRATFQKGVLTVALPKSRKQQENTRRVPINAA